MQSGLVGDGEYESPNLMKVLEEANNRGYSSEKCAVEQTLIGDGDSGRIVFMDAEGHYTHESPCIITREKEDRTLVHVLMENPRFTK
jgi:hypothetical protein